MNSASIYGSAELIDTMVTNSARIFGSAKVSDCEISGRAQIAGTAVLFHCRIINTTIICGDVWNKSPIQIQGSEDFVFMSTHNLISIGIHKYSHGHWLTEGNIKTHLHGYSEDAINEYLGYINLINKTKSIHE